MMTMCSLKQKGCPVSRQIQILSVLATLTLLTAATALARDNARARWWLSPDIATQMQLTDDEIQQLDNVFDAAQLRMIGLRSNVALEKTKLRALLEQRELDETAIVRQHQSEQEARARLSDERLAFLMEARKIIGYERFIKLMEIRDARRRHRYMDKTENPKTPQ